MAKLDQFKGKINFKTDSPQQISKTLGELEAYLKKYEEGDAAKIIEEFKSNNKGNPSHSEKLLTKQFIKAYSKRTDILENLSKSIKKIQEDLVDEQDTTIKKEKPKKRRLARIAGKAKTAVTAGVSKVTNKAKNMFSDILDNFSSLLGGFGALRGLLPLLTGGAMGILLGGLGAAASALLGSTLKSLRWIKRIVQGTLGIGWRLGKSLVKASLWVGKVATRAIIRTGAFMWKVGKFIAKGVMTGIKSLAALMSLVFDKIKGKWNDLRKKSPDGKPQKNQKVPNDAKGGKANSQKGGSKPGKLPKPTGGLTSKIKDTLSTVKGAILKHAGKLKGVGKAVLSGLPKVLAKATPFGLPFMAYDAYVAAKKSDSLTSFGVNFINESLGGLVGLASDDPAVRENPGAFVDKMIWGSDGDEVTGNSGNASSSTASGIGGSSGGSSIETPSVIKEIESLPEGDGEAYITIDGSYDGSPIPDEFLKYMDHPAFPWAWDQIDAGKMTFDQAIEKFKSGAFDGVEGVPASFNDIEINDIHQTMLEEVKNQAVYESVAISSQMSKSVLGAVRATNGLVNSQIQYNSMMINPTNNYYGGMNRASVQG